MRISTKGRYALRMLVDLAQHRDGGFVALKDIAERQNISKKYLEQIIPMLNKASVLRTERGAQGGYMLARTPDKYTIREILELTEGSLSPVSCVDEGAPVCTRSADCPTLPIWQGLADVVRNYLDGITLQDVLDRMGEAGNDYVI